MLSGTKFCIFFVSFSCFISLNCIQKAHLWVNNLTGDTLTINYELSFINSALSADIHAGQKMCLEGIIDNRTMQNLTVLTIRGPITYLTRNILFWRSDNLATSIRNAYNQAVQKVHIILTINANSGVLGVCEPYYWSISTQSEQPS